MDNKFDRKIINIINIILLILIINSLIIIKGNSNEFIQRYQLIIDSQVEIYEGNNLCISVYTIKNNTPYYQIDCIVIFNNNSYYLTYDEPEINIEAPQVNEDTYFKIKAIKTGYISDEKYINIINIENKSKLIITLLDNDFIVEGNAYFSILITDEKGNPISNATIGIQSIISKESIGFTDENGRGRILAPNNRNEIILLAQKNGYINATEKVWINTNPDVIEKILKYPYTIIIIALIILFFSVIIVSIKKSLINIKKNKKQIYKKMNENNLDNDKIKYLNQKNSKNNREDIKIKEAKVEEIRINKKDPDQKIVTLKNQNKENDLNLRKNEKIRNQNYIVGIDEIRYKIDKLTDDVKSFNENKWFEGQDIIREKIDEKLKKIKKN